MLSWFRDQRDDESFGLWMTRMTIARLKDELSWNPDNMAENKRELEKAYSSLDFYLGLHVAAKELGMKPMMLRNVIYRVENRRRGKTKTVIL